MLELDIIKQHVRLEPDFTDDDSLLDTYAMAAARLVENQTGRRLYATDAGEDEDGLVLDDDISTAMLLLIGHWYENREAVVIGSISTSIPLAVDALIAPYRHFQIY